MASFDIQLPNVQDESFKDTETTTWIGKNIPILVINIVQLDTWTHFPLLS